jgi:4-hydroxy-L-threonine phosphate dehydrogenase PdxA
MTYRPIVATVIGDPGGIGPEVCVKALASGIPQSAAIQVLIGDMDTIQRADGICGTGLKLERIGSLTEAQTDSGAIPVFSHQSDLAKRFPLGEIRADSARAAMTWLHEGIRLAESGAAQALVMGPFDSKALALAGFAIDAPEFEPPGTYQLRIGGPLRVVPITEHIRIRDVPATVVADKILSLIMLVDATLQSWGIARPRIAVAGLNPHAMFEEEQAEIIPAIQQAKAAGLDVTGPISPDTVFRQAIDGQYDVVVTMFHDQGQIAVKTTAFSGACTVFLGLGYPRIGVPHGTAMDIAGTGRADPATMISVMTTAGHLASGHLDRITATL